MEQEKFDQTIKIPLKMIANEEEVNLTPVDMSIFDRQKKRGSETPFDRFYQIAEAAYQMIPQEELESYMN